MTLQDLYEKYQSIVASVSTIEHIFVGEINRRGIAVGFHYEGQFSAGISYIVEGTKKPPDRHDVYEGDVVIKSQPKPGFSSFFPQEMSEDEVMNNIQTAYLNRKQITATLYEGETTQGLKIQFYLDDTEKITTAYPIYMGV